VKVAIFQDFLRVGGTENQTVTIANDLKDRAVETSVITCRPGGPLTGRLNDAGIPCHSLQWVDTGASFWAPGIEAHLKAKQPHALLCMGRVANYHGMRLLGRLPHTAIVGSVRTGKYLAPFYLRRYRAFSDIVVNSAWWMHRLVDEGIPEDRIHVIRNRTVWSLQDGQRDSLRVHSRKELGATPETVVFLNVAGFRSRKRQADLIRALARQPMPFPWMLWLVGNGRTRNRCGRLAAKLGVADRVRFVGWSSNPLPYYAGSDVAVSASREDALPNFLVEAQTAGLPVVARDFRGAKEAFDPGASGILIPADDGIETFSAAFAKLGSNAHSREEMGTRARAHAQQAFSPETQSRLHYDVLAGAVERRRLSLKGR
jgi:glycosyltransferase involved in cell wall biosynthesis